MTHEFIKFKQAVAKQFATMRSHDLFRTTAGKDEMWDTYLNSFPPGTNPIFRQRTEYDCSCCRQFIRAVGNVVAIIDGKLVSIWDCQTGDPVYQVVADAMAAQVKFQPIENIFLHTERSAGAEKTFEEAIGGVITWNHFYISIPCGQGNEKNLVVKGADLGPALSEARALHDVLLRSLIEISDEAVDTVLELIAQNSLYRGEEHKFAVTTFKGLKREFAACTFPSERDNFAWLKSKMVPVSVAKIRNTSIGTLLVDLSEGMELEEAVKKFEAMVAPANYKRPTALVTKAMIEAAKAKIESLGLTSALNRRYATLNDISINDVLFANREVKKNLSGNVFDEIADKVADKKPANMDKVEEVGIDKFLADILPKANSIELMVENRHTGNLVSLIAPVDPTARPLFKWMNNFSWSYNGDMADSIKERVKQAGGDVTGDLCCRLAWYNHDDLDLHMREPGGDHIHFGQKGPSRCGGQLDVDMNAGGRMSREPVENIFYRSRQKMQEGVYMLQVNQFCQREAKDVGFEVEIDFLGTVYNFAYDKPVKDRETITVAEIRYSHKDGVHITTSLPFVQTSKEVWSIQTNKFQKVDAVMMSPNYWGETGIGNRHYFFMLNGCANDGTARGFFNEFLKSDLDVHRKVFEIVGSKMKTDEAANQLSGVGFSSTQRNSVLCRVTGNFTRVIKIVF